MFAEGQEGAPESVGESDGVQDKEKARQENWELGQPGCLLSPAQAWSGVSVLVGSVQLPSPTRWGLQHLHGGPKDAAQNLNCRLRGGTKDEKPGGDTSGVPSGGASRVLLGSTGRNGNPGIRFCGRNASAVPTFYSSLSTAIIIFKSEVFNTDSRVGFTYRIAGCSREYQKAFGRLRSPGWPAGYASNVDCAVVLRAPQNHTISLFFHAFGLEDSGGCTRDFLEVRNGSESTSPLLGKYCGTLLPNPIFSQSRDLYLRFKSDSATSGRGYEIIWTSSPSGCGGTLYGDSGLVTSPGYPSTYPNHTHCEWAIIAPGGRPVTVSFSFINIDDPGECVQNYLMLYDGPDANSPSSGPYCGADMDVAPFAASSHRVFIRFHAEAAASCPPGAALVPPSGARPSDLRLDRILPP
ncbi:cubilin-like [Sus scrofa]|uniref:cubilin-like n=1 Tax=Sus scrofa TaxID=9823 RepID=UPI000A2AFB3C|nr:cubilin-like [Sus scrofa]